MMIRILSLKEARETVLRREVLDDASVPEAALAKLSEVTGREVRSAAEGVGYIIADVRQQGDEALRYYSRLLDGQALEALEVPMGALEAAYERIEGDLRAALEHSAARIRRFHEHQVAAEAGWIADDGDSRLGQLVRPLERVGVYAPGGQALYPSSVLMAAIPAQVAGVKEIIMISPPSRARLTDEQANGEDNGEVAIADVILAAAKIAGVHRVFQIGGAQGIAALAYGTQSVPKVDKILGPGGLFTILAMKQVYGVTGIAGLPGPTETLLIADESASPVFVAADLLAQAEHDALASALLLTPSRSLAEEVSKELSKQLEILPRRPIVEASLQRGSAIVLTDDLEEAIALANDYAPEHLCLLTAEPWALVDKIQHAGGIFIGESSCEALGDYIVGPSHIMPTSQTARFNSPVNVRDFQKIISVFAVGTQTLHKTAKEAIRIAQAEGLEGHAEAIRKRLVTRDW